MKDRLSIKQNVQNRFAEVSSDEKLLELLKISEHRFVERKTSLATREVKRTLVAFANSLEESEEAVLFIGVTDAGEVVGVADADSQQKALRNIAENDCFPRIPCNARVLRVSEKEVLVVEVQASTNRPHFTGHAYIRKGSESVKASPQLHAELIAAHNSKVRRILSWGKTPITIHLPNQDSICRAWSGYKLSRLRDYVIEDCDAHCMRYKNLESKHIEATPLDNVQISVDTNKNRPMLIIT